MASIKYQIDSGKMVYFRYAKGFASGGFNVQASSAADVTTPYNPQFAETFTIGTKDAFFEQKLIVDADIFYEKIDDLQEKVFTAVNNVTSTIQNAGKAHKWGLEVQSAWRPTSNFNAKFTYSYLRARYDKFMDGGMNVADNRAFPLLPRNMVSVVLNGIPLRTSNGLLRVTLDYRYSDGYYRYPDPFVSSNPYAVVAGDTRIDAHGVLNGKLSFSDMRWFNGRVYGEVSLWVHNITNESYAYNKIDFGPSFGNLITANFNTPRTFGVSASINW